MKWSYKKFLYLRLEFFLIKNYGSGSDLSEFEMFADVLSSTNTGFSRNEISQIWIISVCVIVDVDAVSITIDEWCACWLACNVVALKHLLTLQRYGWIDVNPPPPYIARRYHRKPSVNTIWETEGLRNPYRIDNWRKFGSWRTKMKRRKCNFICSKGLFTRNARKPKCRYR